MALCDHSILLTKLEHYGIRGNALKLIQSYLSNRKQYVQGGNIKSYSMGLLPGEKQLHVICSQYLLQRQVNSIFLSPTTPEEKFS